MLLFQHHLANIGACLQSVGSGMVNRSVLAVTWLCQASKNRGQKQRARSHQEDKLERQGGSGKGMSEGRWSEKHTVKAQVTHDAVSRCLLTWKR